ncbi:unnamed protein product [Macrosiphum euphorbiae]|uniref:Uncharacterized protein n=1 Tax=Macrosiphum euphorbiae TaxID=13131 RepID=A0AAV0WWR5_9HEMI|nr:unnamed protein product [Macrosiphum euphorbiae]
MWSIVCFIDEDTSESVERRLVPNSIEFGYYNARPLARDIKISSNSSDIVDDNDDSDVDETYEPCPFVRNHSPDVLLSPGNIDLDLNYKIMNNNMANQSVSKTSTPVSRKKDNDLLKCISDDNETSKSDFEEYSQKKKGKMLRSLIRSVTNIKYELKDMTTKMDRIEERQTNMMLYTTSNDYTCNSSGNVLHTNSIDETWNFPLTSFEELDGFEQKLLDDGYKIKLIRKKVFSVLNTCSILFGAVRGVKNYKNCTDIDIIKPLKPYLANATARGKPKRKD